MVRISIESFTTRMPVSAQYSSLQGKSIDYKTIGFVLNTLYVFVIASKNLIKMRENAPPPCKQTHYTVIQFVFTATLLTAAPTLFEDNGGSRHGNQASLPASHIMLFLHTRQFSYLDKRCDNLTLNLDRRLHILTLNLEEETCQPKPKCGQDP